MGALIEIPLAHRLEWSHSPRLVGAEFSADGRTVFVHMHTPMLDLFAVVVGYAWWIALALFVVGMAVSWWWLLRVNARPQRNGVPYCRKCNYELSGQVAWNETERAWAPAPNDNGGDGGRCPECGAELAKVRAKRGVATWKRRLWPAGLAVVVGAVFLVAGGLRLYGASGINTGDASRLLSVELAEWVEREGIQWLWPFMVMGDRIVAIDVESGREIREVLKARESSFVKARFSPDGKTILRLTFRGLDQALVQMHAAERGGRNGAISVPFSRPSMDARQFVGMTGRGNHLLICGRSGQRDVLVAVDLNSGAIRTLHEAPASQESWVRANWSADRWDHPSTLVRSSRLRESQLTKNIAIEVFDFSDGRLIPRVDWNETTQLGERHAVRTGASVVVLPCGERGLVPTTTLGASMLELDLVGGDVARALPSQGRGGSSIASAGVVALISESVPEHSLMIYHTEPTELIGIAFYPRDVSSPSSYLSPGGRSAAAIGLVRPASGHSAASGFRQALLLYDLAPVLEAIARRRTQTSNDQSDPE